MRLIRYQAAIAGLRGGPGVSTWYFDTELGPSTDQAAVDKVATFLNAVKAYISTSVNWTGESFVEVLNPADGKITGTNGVTGFSITGTNAGTVLPPVNQMLVRWQTGVFVNGRALRGHMFVPGFCEDTNEPGGVPQAAVVTVVKNAAATLAASTAGLVVYSRKYHEAHAVTTVDVWNQWSFLRGRRDG